MKYAINARKAPEASGPYSQGTTAGRLVFTSGQLPIAHDAEILIEGDITAQTERVIDVIELVLEEVGCTLDDIAQTTIYLTDLSNLEAVNNVFEERFPMPAPARWIPILYTSTSPPAPRARPRASPWRTGASWTLSTALRTSSISARGT